MQKVGFKLKAQAKRKKKLTFPASLSGRPESLSEDLPLVRLSKEWQEVASNRASYGLSSSGPGAIPEISSLTFSRSPMSQNGHRLEQKQASSENNN